MMKEVIFIARYLDRLGYIAGREGNISLRRGELVYIKASGVYLAEATEKDFVKVGLDGKVYGKKRPSIELPMHLTIYKSRNDVSAIIHSHPPYVTALSLLEEDFEPKTEEAKLYLKKGVGFVGSLEPGSMDLAKAVEWQIKKGHDVVVLKGHGLLAVGSTLREAFERTIATERCATALFLTGLAKGKWLRRA